MRARVLTKREIAERLRSELDGFIREELTDARREVTRAMREANLALAQLNQALQTVEALWMDVAQAEQEAIENDETQRGGGRQKENAQGRPTATERSGGTFVSVMDEYSTDEVKEQ